MYTYYEYFSFGYRSFRIIRVSLGPYLGSEFEVNIPRDS